jgi:hypothetical protein
MKTDYQGLVTERLGEWESGSGGLESADNLPFLDLSSGPALY